VCSLPKVRIFFGICKFFKKKVQNIMKKGYFWWKKQRGGAAGGDDNIDNLRPNQLPGALSGLLLTTT